MKKTTHYLTTEETIFLNALIEDYEERGENSFISMIFLGRPFTPETVEEMFEHWSLEDWHNDDPYECAIGMDSNWILNTTQGHMIAKYKNFFVGTGSEGEFFAISEELHNMPFRIICNEIGDLKEQSYESEESEYKYGLPKVIDYYKKFYDIDYLSYIESYKNFCLQFNLVYLNDYGPEKLEAVALNNELLRREQERYEKFKKENSHLF